MKLKSVDQPKIFYQVAHRLIVLQKEPFSIEDLLKQYYKKCGGNINLDHAKKVVLKQLNEMMKSGIVKTIKDGKYFTDCSPSDLQKELAKDESWVALY